jgi:pyruvate formate lyase activating enzyme
MTCSANSILAGAKDSGLSTCIQTCGLGIEKIDISLCDYIYYDLKTMNNLQHIEITGAGKDVILNQLAKLAAVCPEKIKVRTVIAKGITDNVSHVDDISKFLKEIGLTRLELNKFHPYGSSKAESVGIFRKEMGKEYIPDETKIKELEEAISKNEN